ncbi:MAG: NAD-dependent epimerase/dehydratase family protein [Acidimicrobiales bacterium]
MRVVVTGANGAIGRHVVGRLSQMEEVDELVPLDRAADPDDAFDLLEDDLVAVLQPHDVVVHLASSPLRFAGEQSAARNDREIAARLFEAATASGVGQVVLASSAMVYGAWADNPIPLTEAAPIRPNPEFRFGAIRAEIEQMGRDWAEVTGASLSILRAATTLARGRENGLANLLHSSASLRNTEGDAPAQFLHAEDFAKAVEILVLGQHEGVFNVAADGWLRPSEVVALRGTPETPLRAPSFVISAVSEGRRRLGASTHPGLTPYLQHSWVVANDRLKALGWKPEFSNEEAYVAGHRPSVFDGITAKRRQELSLGVAGAASAAGAFGLLWLLARLWRRWRR